jgi:hypothetical protein
MIANPIHLHRLAFAAIKYWPIGINAYPRNALHHPPDMKSLGKIPDGGTSRGGF